MKKMDAATRGGAKPLMRTAPLFSKFEAFDLDFVVNPNLLAKDYEES